MSVYQEPSLVPDLDIASNLRLTRTPVEPFRAWLAELGIPSLDLTTAARALPLATLRVIDLARALAVEPAVLMLDEMTAALPADLTERVLEVIGRRRGTASSIIFISHRMIEIGAVCDRATVLREGETVGVVDVEPGSEERIVRLMLGDIDGGCDRPAVPAPVRRRRLPSAARRASAPRAWGSPRSSSTSRSTCTRARCWASSHSRARARTSCSTSWPARSARGRASCSSTGDRRPSATRPTRSAPVSSTSRPIAPRRSSCSARSARTSPCRSRHRSGRGARSTHAPRDRRVNGAVERLEIDTRAQGEVRRLSGGNQQKVTIARWVAGGVRTMLCFDPTRGIDIGTKRQIYALLRELAEAGAAVLLYTSELKEIQLACDRAIVIFNGRVVAEIPVEEADEPTLLRAAYDLPPDAAMPEEIAATELAAEGDAEPSTAEATA